MQKLTQTAERRPGKVKLIPVGQGPSLTRAKETRDQAVRREVATQRFLLLTPRERKEEEVSRREEGNSGKGN